MARKVLLLTTVDWVSTARYAGGFAAASWTVDAIAPKAAPVAVSRYVERHYRYRPLLALSSLRAAIRQSRPDLIVTCDDRGISHLLRLYRNALAAEGEASPLVALIRRSLGAPQNFARMISRSDSLAAAVEAGIRVPQTLPVADEAELDACLLRLGYPAVLKADGSWGGRETDWRPANDPWHRALYREYFCPQAESIRSAADGVRALQEGGHPFSRGFGAPGPINPR